MSQYNRPRSLICAEPLESRRLFAVTGDYSINEFNGTRFRSARSTPASSSLAISASRRRAKPWCASRNGLATSTRASTVS